MKKTILLFVAATLLFVQGVKASDRIVMEGSTTVLPIAQKTAEVYMDGNPQAQISVRGGGSSVGITSLIDGTCDIADASRSIKDTELEKAASRGVSPKAHVVAMDGIVLIVNPSNTVNGLTKQQAKDIFTGKVSNWSEVGGRNEKIVSISRDSSSGTFEAFGALVLGGAKVRPDALLQASNQAVVSIVSQTPGAIGYVGLGYVTGAVKSLEFEGVKASKETVLTGKYKVGRPLFMYTNGDPKGATKNFIDFVKSAEGQKIAEQEGFVGLK